MSEQAIDISKLEQHAQEAADLLKQLANKHRLMLLCLLIDQELSVSELNAHTALSQSALSQHLASLRAAGLVATRRESQTIYYRLSGDEAIKIIAVLKSIYCP
ncbi:metalloregulator ArsR/SmtB family transcription factor [Dasania sp. GY-MA-18]|uniref:Metalloregulator ArsR/SmtB family transcription factor n=1 Tax=Dasania phycosphaerae TaxID=2950436 RepID=A0A9J6RP93_9GAMM|nr:MULTISPECIES: metalloregulator ArsR/SmtB family transcription factor [Dasania]MCR8923509.1 metalloregulator ArsR/SmtB family transcription factor [Dasania sp. GY-MA-18]MCZ0865943.1 metalloregulator ArsR/SmtB family transcription factor [Dasania phycosphaerae]MCZ0869667.1 metalloregulator ArsR/SmtB family transcription factor [Dasania phycosphaerae]